jgi:hypothetical protein
MQVSGPFFLVAVTRSCSPAINTANYAPLRAAPISALLDARLHSADLAAYESAEAAALTRVKGAAVTRNAKFLVLHADLEHLMAEVSKSPTPTPPTRSRSSRAPGLPASHSRRAGSHSVT